MSDEFTVPLCAIHHHHIHTTSKEREWWQERNVDPLKIAYALWQQSREKQGVPTQPGSTEEFLAKLEQPEIDARMLRQEARLPMNSHVPTGTDHPDAA